MSWKGQIILLFTTYWASDKRGGEKKRKDNHEKWRTSSFLLQSKSTYFVQLKSFTLLFIFCIFSTDLYEIYKLHFHCFARYSNFLFLFILLFYYMIWILCIDVQKQKKLKSRMHDYDGGHLPVVYLWVFCFCFFCLFVCLFFYLFCSFISDHLCLLCHCIKHKDPYWVKLVGLPKRYAIKLDAWSWTKHRSLSICWQCFMKVH